MASAFDAALTLLHAILDRTEKDVPFRTEEWRSLGGRPGEHCTLLAATGQHDHLRRDSAVRVAAAGTTAPQLTAGETPVPLREVTRPTDLRPGTWRRDKPGVVACFDLTRGRSVLTV